MKRSKPSPPRPGKLFAEPHSAPPPASVHIAQVDGASRGNPGPASYAVIIRAPNGRPVFELGKYLGRATNNVAEYYALITALDYAANHDIRALRVRSDSQLLVRQMQGLYKVKSAELQPLHERALKLARGLGYFAIEYVPRAANRAADRLANEALDRSEGRTSAPSLDEAGKSKFANPGAQHAEHRQLGVLIHHSSLVTRTIRARYSNGVLVPAEPLDLAEGEEVQISIAKTARG